MAAYWAWQALRHRSLTLPTIANPLMEFGGLCGESKTDLFESMSPEGRKWLAPYVSIERGPQAELTEISPGCWTWPRRRDSPSRWSPSRISAATGRGSAGARRRGASPLPRGLPQRGPGAAPIPGPMRGRGRHLPCPASRSSETGLTVSTTLKFFPDVTGDGNLTLEAS